MEKGVPIRTVSRSLAILQLINRKHDVTLMEIARATDLPYPTTYRIVQTLMHEGLIECDPVRKRYFATRLVQSLSDGYQGRDTLTAVARPFLVDLTLRFEWPVSLSSGFGTAMMLRDSTYDMSVLSYNHYYPGYTLPLGDCAAGHVHMACRNEAERMSLLAALEEEGVRPQVLRTLGTEAELTQIRQAGYYLHERSQGTANPGKTSSLACPIFQEQQEVAVLSLSYFPDDITPAQAIGRYASALTACARDIEHAISHAYE